MSTIFACYNQNNNVSTKIIADMVSASAYWQPDDISENVSAKGACRMARAAMFTSSRSKQEHIFRDSHGSLICANARLDNREDLSFQLSIKNLSEKSDGELILAAYRKWGEDCPRFLLGDFVFIIWDEQNQSLFCARDHFGVKILFFAQTAAGWIITNEHNAFFSCGALKKRIKESWLVTQVWGLGPAPFSSPCQGVNVLPSAHSLVVKGETASLKRYWTLKDTPEWCNEDEEVLIAELRLRFKAAIKSRLDSEYPLAAELSEGLDSNGIVGHAAKMLGSKTLHTLSYNCIPLTESNEHIWGSTYEDIFAMHALHRNISPVWRSASEGDLKDENDRARASIAEYLGVPMGLKGGHFLRSRLAAEQGARVLLSGWGGDHCVSSYGDFYESELLRQGKFRIIHELFRGKHERRRGASPLKQWLVLLLKHSIPQLFRFLKRKSIGLERSLCVRAALHPLKREFVARYKLRQKLRTFTETYQRYSVKEHHRRELFDVGVERRLVEAEVAGRLYKIEYRFPMLHLPLVELAYNMPSKLKIKNGVERYMFRRLLDGVTTEKIQWRVKSDVSHPQIHRASFVQSEFSAVWKSSLASHFLELTKREDYEEASTMWEAELRNLHILVEMERVLGEHIEIVTDPT